MKLFVGYTSSEGQTRKIAQHVADRLVDAGHSVELAGLADVGDIDLGRFDRAVLGGSLHVGHYQKALSEFAADHAQSLNKMPTLMLSVSLAAAGHDAEDWRALDKIVADFQAATDWTPSRIIQVAGAYTPTQYDVFRRFAMRRIIAKKDPDADLDRDREYTDWDKLDAEIDGWLKDTGKRPG